MHTLTHTGDAGADILTLEAIGRIDEEIEEVTLV
jgi:hypothetical protein